MLRSYGISGLQKYIRHHIQLAKRFEEHVLQDKRFEICNQVKVGAIEILLISDLMSSNKKKERSESFLTTTLFPFSLYLSHSTNSAGIGLFPLGGQRQAE